MYPLLRSSLSLLLAFCCFSSYASHLVGGEMTYRYRGDTTIGSTTLHKYEITFTLYEDCYLGQPEAIAQDNPAFLSIYNNGDTSHPICIDTNVYYSSSSLLTPGLHNACGTSSVPSYLGCTLKKVFQRTYLLPNNPSGYLVSYQRCCRSATLLNVNQPGDVGMSYFCTIPGTPTNTSARFNADPPQITCINHAMSLDYSATDADGDSLSYELCAAYIGASTANIKPIPNYPTTFVSYKTPYTASAPLAGNPAISIDAHSGIISGAPTVVGRYVLCVCCTEWRSGVAINVVRREFALTVGDCGTTILAGYKPDAGHDTVVYTGAHIQLHGADAVSYNWSPGSFFGDSTVSDPACYFPEAGDYSFVLHGVSDSGCTGTDTVHVIVLDHSTYAVPNAFTPDNDGRNDILSPFNMKQATLVNFRVYDRWGQMVHDGSPFNPGWDGRYHGALQQPGVYFWSLQYIDNHGATQIAKGNVTLLR